MDRDVNWDEVMDVMRQGIQDMALHGGKPTVRVYWDNEQQKVRAEYTGLVWDLEE